MPFKNHFSGAAADYQAYRPKYPDALFGYLASLVPTHDLAWDCATGNGQSAIKLTPYFRSIVALDASPEQLALASTHERIIYVLSLADRTPLPDASVDLVTVASAFHWLDFPRFYDEVRRVARPNAILAVWGYKLPSVNPAVEAVVQRLDTDVLRDFWLPETTLAVDGLSNYPVPF